VLESLGAVVGQGRRRRRRGGPAREDVPAIGAPPSAEGQGAAIEPEAPAASAESHEDVAEDGETQ
jgi:hypothetical protein